MSHNTLLRQYFHDTPSEDIVEHWYRLSWLERVIDITAVRSDAEGMLLDLPVGE